MEIGSVTTAGATLPGHARSSGAEKVEEKRRERSLVKEAPEQDTKKVASEEILNKIKELTDDGVYSVRFERNEAHNGLVAQVIDRESGEVIRQFPAEEILELSQRLDDLRGRIIDTKS